MRRLLILMLLGCSGPDESPPPPVSSPTPEPTRWEQILTITDLSCLRCHEGAPHLESERQFLTARVKGRLERREMPPPSSPESRNMSQSTRNDLLSYFGENKWK